jgi:hypothetical protein
MKYEIIEDCSPYYIRFTHEGIDDVINYSNECVPDLQNLNLFSHHVLSELKALHILSLTPISDKIPLRKDRVSLFISKPGLYYRAHKDGLNNRFSINYISRALDDKCSTNWYSDEDLKDYSVDTLNIPNKASRECIGFVKENHIPIKSFVAKQNECVLFNTEIFHDWDNRASTNERIVLTLRIIEELKPQTYFEDARKILFNY